MASINRATLMGNLGRDPEVRSVSSGDRVANFSLATTEKWRDKTSGEPREQVQWHRIVVWGRLADVVEKYLRKGSRVLVEGKIETRKYKDNAGADREVTEIVLRGYDSRLALLDGPPASGANPSGAAPARTQESSKPAASGSGFDDMDDEIPF